MTQRQFEQSALALLVIIAIAVGAVFLVIHEVHATNAAEQTCPQAWAGHSRL